MRTERELGVFSLQERRVRGDISICKFLMEEGVKKTEGIFSVLSEKTRGNGHILKHGKFHLNIRNR